MCVEMADISNKFDYYTDLESLLQEVLTCYVEINTETRHLILSLAREGSLEEHQTGKGIENLSAELLRTFWEIRE